MKHCQNVVILIFSIFILLPITSEASFDLDLVTEEMQEVNVGDYAEFEIYLTNTGSESDVFWLGYFFPYETFPDGWECEFWIGEDSYPDSTTVELAADEELEIFFRVYVESNGLGVVAFAVHPVADPMDEDYVILTVVTPDISIKNEKFSEVPAQPKVYPNYPNPFNPITTFRYEISDFSMVSIKIYDLNGRLVENLLEKEHIPGFYTLVWQADHMSSGVYLAVLKTKNFVDIQEITLLK